MKQAYKIFIEHAHKKVPLLLFERASALAHECGVRSNDIQFITRVYVSSTGEKINISLMGPDKNLVESLMSSLNVDSHDLDSAVKSVRQYMDSYRACFKSLECSYLSLIKNILLVSFVIREDSVERIKLAERLMS